MSDSTTPCHVTQISSVFLTVTDQDRAIAFYRDTLGFELRVDQEFGSGFRWVEVAPPGAQSVIALATPDAERGNQPGGEAPFSLDTSNLDAAMADLSTRGVEFGDVMGDGDSVPRMARFTDPDGNRMLLIEAPATG
jgi:catechol 2,3-dioxygenase-like lactoylglutathione lyase family enzyme